MTAWATWLIAVFALLTNLVLLQHVLRLSIRGRELWRRVDNLERRADNLEKRIVNIEKRP